MSTSRFTRLITYLKEQEDQVRSELGKVDQSIRIVEEEVEALQAELRSAAQCDSLLQRQQLLTFSTHCADRDAVFQHQLHSYRQEREGIQERLLTLWRRRRSLETLEQRESDAAEARSERQRNADILDGAVRAWYLQDIEQAQDTVQLLDSEVLS